MDIRDGGDDGPWAFHRVWGGFGNVVVDSRDRYIVAHVRTDVGLLIASAPTMRQALVRIAAIAEIGTEARAIAEGALEALAEREAITLFDGRAG